MDTKKTEKHPPKQHVDLFNFDDPRFESYRYVLTSPRSIEACQRIGVKPVTLLPKSFARFQEEMKNSGLDIRELYDRFLENEKKRLELVERCRSERRKVVDEESQNSQPEYEEMIVKETFTVPSKTFTENTDMPKKSSLKNKSEGKVSTGVLGVPEKFNAEQSNLLSEADKAHYLAEARATHSARLAALKQQMEELELETRMLRLESSKSGRRTGDNPAMRRRRTQSAGRRSNMNVTGVSLLPAKSKPTTTPAHEILTSHVDDLERQVENQRALLEQSQMVEDWRMLVAERKKAEEEQAQARRRRLIVEKKLKAQQERLEKELAQRGNVRRLEEEEYEYQQMLRSSIASKDRRTDELRRDRDEGIERSRNISRMSEKLRADLRRSINADSFDKKARRVVIENAVGRGPRTNLMNVSKLKLG